MALSFDVMQAFFWSVTYILIFVFNIKYKYTAMPLFAMCNNFAWETVALVRDILFGSWGIGSVIHIAWFTLDIAIVITYLLLCKKLYCKKIFSLLIYVVSLLICVLSFNTWALGMLISSFIIDFIMAVEYFIYSSKEVFPANRLSVSICTFKLIGDLCAWIYYMNDSRFVLVIGFFVLILNILCLKNVMKRNHNNSPSRNVPTSEG